MGEPADWFWRDAESFAEMFCGYYTDREPEPAFVVEIDGVVSGYLLGATDASAAWNPAAVAGRHILRRGIAFRRGTGPFIWRSMKDGLVDLGMRRVKVSELDFAWSRPGSIVCAPPTSRAATFRPWPRTHMRSRSSMRSAFVVLDLRN